MSSNCAYCTGPLGTRIYRHEKGKHPEPRPAFCSFSCIGYFDNRRNAERRAFTAIPIIGIITQLGILTVLIA